MAILGTWVTFLTPKTLFSFIVHSTPFQAYLRQFKGILRVFFFFKIFFLKYSIWETCKQIYGEIEQDPWIWCIC